MRTSRSRPRSSVPSRNVPVGALRQALRGEADVAVLVVGSVADQRGQERGAERDQRDEHDHDQRHHRGAVAAQPFPGQLHGAAALDPCLAFELGGVRDRRIGVAFAQLDAHGARSLLRRGRVEREVGREVVDRGPGQGEQLAVGQREVAGHRVARGRRPPGATSSGSSVRHRSCAFGQRGWNRQPDGGAAGDGRSPRRTIRSRLGERVRVRGGHGREQRARCRGGGCAREGPRSSAISTILPRYMTAIRSLTWRTTDRSCVMNTYVRLQLVLQLGEQVDDLRLDRDVQRRHRLVAHHELRPQRQRPRDADALALSAGELGGEAVVVLGVEAHELHQLLHPALAVARRRRRRGSRTGRR